MTENNPGTRYTRTVGYRLKNCDIIGRKELSRTLLELQVTCKGEIALYTMLSVQPPFSNYSIQFLNDKISP